MISCGAKTITRVPIASARNRNRTKNRGRPVAALREGFGFPVKSARWKVPCPSMIAMICQ